MIYLFKIEKADDTLEIVKDLKKGKKKKKNKE